MHMRERLYRLMAGRYGPDQFYYALFALALVLTVAGSFCGLYVGAALRLLGYGALVWAMVRMMSRNFSKRRLENDRFLRLWNPVSKKLRGGFSRVKCAKTHRFFKCPGCKNLLRVPRGKGKIQITCPRCGERFVKKT